MSEQLYVAMTKEGKYLRKWLKATRRHKSTI